MDEQHLPRTLKIIGFHVESAIIGSGANLYPLLRRLNAIGSPEPLLKGRTAALELERSVWVNEIREDLLPESQEIIATSMRASRGLGSARDDPWCALDTTFVTEQAVDLRRAWAKAQVNALEACERFVTSGKVAHLRHAVDILEAAWWLERSARAPRMTILACAGQKERLRAALDAALARDARAFLVGHVRARIAGTGSEVDQLLSDRRWTDPYSYELKDLGPIFAPGFQGVYDAAREADARDRAAQQQRWAEEQSTMRARMGDMSEGLSKIGEVATSGMQAPHEETSVMVEDTQVAAKSEAEIMREAGHVRVELPDGPKWMPPAMAESVIATLKWQKRHDAAREQRRLDREEYERQLATR